MPLVPSSHNSRPDQRTSGHADADGRASRCRPPVDRGRPKALSKLFFDRLGVLEEGTPEFQYARNTLIEMNLSLVKFAARRFPNLGNGEMEEILQVGTIGLIKAIDRFDLSRESSSAPLNERRPDYAALGHTIDYRLRLRLGSDPGPAAIAGVELIGGDLPAEGAPAPAVRANLHMIGTNVLDRLHAHLVNPSRRLEDITEQMNLAEEPFAPLRDLPADQRVYGPVFAGSADVKADADFITDGFLIDCKALTGPTASDGRRYSSSPGTSSSTTTIVTTSARAASTSPAKAP
ncbi:sigma factor [Streptomyces niveus]|uniref:sigma factor n=1 Tax=Streptomyces niveus TaxID=193462 RepID=UPI003691C8F9